MKINWKFVNIIILIIECFICFFGIFYKHISFGMGLGDLLFYGILFISTLIHVIATIKTKETEHYKSLAIFFFIIISLICLKATIWRGSEYTWNGEIFYNK